MPKRNTSYQYGDGDDPIKVANQFGITPTQLLAANPGGSPFVTGQNINIPFQYSAPQTTIGPQPANPPAAVQQYNAPIGPQPAMSTFQTPPGYGPNSQPTRPPQPFGSGYGTDDSWFRTTAQNTAANAANQRIQTGTMNPPAGASGDFYGYERDPETGRSIRVVKNSATSNFLKELRWDPQARRYVSIGKLLKQGKLDLKGNWHTSSRRQKQQKNLERKKKQQTQKEDFTLSNSLISFSASSG